MRINPLRALMLGGPDPDTWKTAALFAIIVFGCTFLGWLLLPGLFVMLFLPGYLVAYTRNVATGEDRLPSLGDMNNLWHGFVVLIVSIIYSLPAMGIMVLCLGGSVISLLTGMKMNSALAAAGGIAGLGMMAVAAIAFVLVCYFFTPAIALQYCKANQFGDCFKFGEIFATIMRSPLDYLMLVLPFLAYLGLQFIPFVGQLLGPVLMLASSHLIGQYGAQVMEMSSNSPVPSDVGFNRF